MSVLTRNRKEYEDMQKQIFRSKFHHYKELCNTTANPFKRRGLRRPSLIEFKKLPEYKYKNCFTLPVIYFLETALLFMVNAENIQTWFFEEEFRGYFISDFTLEESTRHLVLRLMDRARHPDLERDPAVDDFLDNITDVTYYFDYDKEEFPDTVNFALYIMSLDGPVAKRLQLHKDLDEIEKFINSVLDKKVFFFEEDDDEEDEEEPETSSSAAGTFYVAGTSSSSAGTFYVESPYVPTSPPYPPPPDEEEPLGGGWGYKIYNKEIIDLVHEDDDDDVPSKRKYDEIIDLTVSEYDDM